MHEQIDRAGQKIVRDDLFRLLVESVRDYAIFHLDPQGYIRSWNEGARRFKGYEASEIIGQHFSVFYLPDEILQNKPAHELIIAARDGRWEEEGWRLRKDGTRFWANVVITALYDPQGQVVGFAKVTRDLTERKIAEEQRAAALELERQARKQAEESLAELRTLHSLTETALTRLNIDDLLNEYLIRVQDTLEVAVIGLLLLDQNRDLLIPMASRGLDIAADTLMPIPFGRGFAGRIASERRTIAEDISQANPLNPALYEMGIRSLLGVPLLAGEQTVGVLYVGSQRQRTFDSKDGRFLQIVGDRIALAIDRARLIEAEQAARIEAELADARLSAQDAFLAVAAHELRSPTAAVKTAVQLLMRRITQTDGDHEAWVPLLDTANQQADRLTSLIDKLIESVRVDSGQLGLEFVRTNVAALVNQVVELSRTSSTNDHEIVVSSPDELWAWVDPVRFDEVVSNILENSIKYSEPGEKIEVHLDQPEGDTFRLTIRDYGNGVPLEDRPHLFERFYKGPDGRVDRGLGLGLYICSEIVKGHGGEIQVEYPDDRGTCFTITLPAKAPQ